MSADYPDFQGKLILVYHIGGSSKDSALIEEAYFEKQANRLFLVGRLSSALPRTTWSREAPYAIAWDRVERYMVFDSTEEWIARNKRLNSRPPGQLGCGATMLLLLLLIVSVWLSSILT
jgi:hypothetical protein